MVKEEIQSDKVTSHLGADDAKDSAAGHWLAPSRTRLTGIETAFAYSSSPRCVSSVVCHEQSCVAPQHLL